MYIPNIDPQETARAARSVQLLNNWLLNVPPDTITSEAYNAALDAVNNAILETRKYLRHRREGGDRNAETENLLSRLWSNASSAIRPYEPVLADLCMVKGHGWADEAIWSDPQFENLPIEIDQMLAHLRAISQHRPPVAGLVKLHASAPYASWIFGGAILIFLMTVVFADVNPNRFPIIRFLMALSAALFAFFFVGGVFLQGTLKSFFISATGGFVLFILIQFVFDPFAVLPAPDPKSSPTPASTPSNQPTSLPTESTGTKPNSERMLVSGDEKAGRLKSEGEALMSRGKFDEAISKFDQALAVPAISHTMQSQLHSVRRQAVNLRALNPT